MTEEELDRLINNDTAIWYTKRWHGLSDKILKKKPKRDLTKLKAYVRREFNIDYLERDIPRIILAATYGEAVLYSTATYLPSCAHTTDIIKLYSVVLDEKKNGSRWRVTKLETK